MKKLLLLLLLPVCLYAQTIRPTFISQLRLTQLTTAQEGTMTLVEGDVWENITIGCIRYRLASSTVCVATVPSSAVLLNPTTDQRIAGNFNLFAAKIHNIRFVDPSGEFTTIQAAHDNTPAAGGYIFVPAGDRTLPSDLTLSKPVTIIAGAGTWTLGTNRILFRSFGACIIGPNPGIPDSTTGQLILDYNGTAAAVDIGDGTTGLRGVCLKNLRIQANAGVAQGSATAVGLKTTSISSSVFDSIQVDEFLAGTGWEATTTAAAGGSILNEVTNFRARNVKFGFKVTPVVEPNTVKAWRFYGGSVLGTAVAGSVGFDFASTTSLEGGGHVLFGTDSSNFDVPYRIDSPSISLIGSRSETVTTAHIQILGDGSRTQIFSHQFLGAGTNVLDAGTLTLRWDVDAPIAVDNRSDGGDGALIFDNEAAIMMKEAGGTQRLVSEMTSGNVYVLGISTNQTALRGSTVRLEGNTVAIGSTTIKPESTGQDLGDATKRWDAFLETVLASPLEGTIPNIPRWIFKQVDHTDMTAAATADTFTLWTLPANTMIHDVVGTVVTPWKLRWGSQRRSVRSVPQVGQPTTLHLTTTSSPQLRCTSYTMRQQVEVRVRYSLIPPTNSPPLCS
jgi:hypothetical protein